MLQENVLLANLWPEFLFEPVFSGIVGQAVTAYIWQFVASQDKPISRLLQTENQSWQQSSSARPICLGILLAGAMP
jgi:hypothetical protein